MAVILSLCAKLNPAYPATARLMFASMHYRDASTRLKFIGRGGAMVKARRAVPGWSGTPAASRNPRINRPCKTANF